jgi:hypothetical protein
MPLQKCFYVKTMNFKKKKMFIIFIITIVIIIIIITIIFIIITIIFINITIINTITIKIILITPYSTYSHYNLREQE